MATEEQIKDLAHSIWEQEGRPEGKHMDHYFRAKQILEEREAAHVIQLAPPPPAAALPPPGKSRAGGRRKRKPETG